MAEPLGSDLCPHRHSCTQMTRPTLHTHVHGHTPMLRTLLIPKEPGIALSLAWAYFLGTTGLGLCIRDHGFPPQHKFPKS